MNEYDEQAHAFLDKTGAKIEARFIGYGPHFPGEKEKRDRYAFRITRGTRVYEGEFGESIAETEERIEKVLKSIGPAYSGLAKRYMQGGADALYFVSWQAVNRVERAMKKAEAEASEWKDVRDADAWPRPHAYSILACLTTMDPGESVDDFAEEYGYTKPSEALRVFEAVHKEWRGVRELFTDEEICQLAEIV